MYPAQPLAQRAGAPRIPHRRAGRILIDDFGLALLGADAVRDQLEILDDRYDRGSTLITSHLPIDQ